MVVTNLNPNGTDTESKGKGKGKAKPILVSPEALSALENGDKNVQINSVVHPKLYAKLITHIASEPNNVVEGELKRTAYSQAIRKAVAAYVDYTGDLALSRGGNVIGIVTAFNTVVGSMFEMARSMGAMFNMAEPQMKELAFAKAKESIAAHPQLVGVDVTDEVLEKLWSGAEFELDIDDDDDDDDDAPDEA